MNLLSSIHKSFKSSLPVHSTRKETKSNVQYFSMVRLLANIAKYRPSGASMDLHLAMLNRKINHAYEYCKYSSVRNKQLF